MLSTMGPLYPSHALEKFCASLDQSEKDSLQEFRNHLGNPAVDDVVLIRFLRARRHNIQKSAKMFLESKQTMEELCHNSLLETFEPEKSALKYYPLTYFGIDNDGCPIVHEAIGSVDAHGLMRCACTEDLLRRKMLDSAIGMKLLELRTRVTGDIHKELTVIFDLEGLSHRHMHRAFVNLFTSMTSMFESNYPESLHRLFILNPPFIFPAAFAIVKPFLNEATRNKFIILGSNKQTNYKVLCKYIDPKWIPQRYGGTVPDDAAGLKIFEGPVPVTDLMDSKLILSGCLKLEASKRQPIHHSVDISSGSCLTFWINVNGQMTMSLTSPDGKDLLSSRTVDCSLGAQRYRFICREPGTYMIHLSIPARSWTSTKIVELKVIVDSNPSANRAATVLHNWIKQHEPEHEQQLLDHIPNISQQSWIEIPVEAPKLAQNIDDSSQKVVLQDKHSVQVEYESIHTKLIEGLLRTPLVHVRTPV